MKCQIPQISWHSRDPVLSVDFQPIKNDVFRLASGGTDKHVLIWYVTYQENNSVKIECASDLSRHNKSVNVVRFSPSGEYLASGDDEGAMFIWRLKERDQIDLPKDDEDANKEEWYPAKLLRGHLEDVNDISWSKDGNFLVSASLDNTAIIWDMQKYVKVYMLTDFKGYVQGISWDPLNQYIASIGTDRTLRIHNISSSKKAVYRISKAPWTNSTEKGTFKARLFYDDTLKSYCRRLTFTPDGELLIVPSGIVEKGEKFQNTTYVFSKHAPTKPVISLPTGDKYTVAVRCNPFLYKLRRNVTDSSDKENEKGKVMIDLPYRMIFAVAASDSVLLYDTEQLTPFAYVSNIHYTHLSDLAWSPDGLTLVASSTDGYCTFIIFSREELGEIYVPEVPKETEENLEEIVKVNEKKDINESSHVQSVSTEKDKKTDSPAQSKGLSVTKSPKASISQISKEESETPLSKNAKNSAENKKSKKSPKMCSIKKFFVSPKTVASSNTNITSETLKQSSVNEKANSGKTTSEIEIITVSDTPEKEETKNQQPMVIDRDESKRAVSLADTGEPMDVDEELLNKSPKPSTSKESGKQTKCKVRLDFTSKGKSLKTSNAKINTLLKASEPVKIIDDNASDVDISKSPSNDKTSIKVEVKQDENDWKLELSQDDEIVPMETAPVIPDKKPEKQPVAPQAPKRRIAFVTLSSKPSFKK